MQFILNHDKIISENISQRSTRTFQSSVFEQGHLRETLHKTNLGHKKDHNTQDLFGDQKMEPVKKHRQNSQFFNSRTPLPACNYPEEKITASQRKSKQYLDDDLQYQKIDKAISQRGNWKDTQYQSHNNIENLQNSPIKRRQDQLKSTILPMTEFEPNTSKQKLFSQTSDWKELQYQKNDNRVNNLNASDKKRGELEGNVFELPKYENSPAQHKRLSVHLKDQRVKGIKVWQ